MMIVNNDKCVGCTKCVGDCIVTDIEMVNGKAHIKNETCIKCGHCIATCPKDAISTDEYNMGEVKPYKKEEFDIDPENLLNFIKFRRSVRKFRDMPVEDEKILKIIEAGRFTQTGTNAQDVKYIVVKDKINELRELVLKELKKIGEYMLSKDEMKDYHRYARKFINMHDEFFDPKIRKDGLFFNAPVVILTTADKYAINAILASGNMELMTNSLGLGTFFSGFLTKATESNKEIHKLLSIDENLEIQTCMVLGYPAIKYFRTVPRKAADISWV